jgi:hypothetical protein
MLGGLISPGCLPPAALCPVPGPAAEGPPLARLAVVGAIDGADPARWSAIAADIDAWDPAAVIWTGDIASPGSARAWRHLPAEVPLLGPALAVPGGDDLRRDRAAKRFDAHFASGSRWVLDVPGWRLVGLPASGDTAVEAGFWMPRVLGPTAAYEHAIVVVGGPPQSLVPGLPSSQGPRLASIATESAGGRLPLVIGGDTGANELFLPDGPWGTAKLVAGNAGIEGQAWPNRPVHGLQSEFALGVAMHRHGDRTSPLSGWWTLELADAALDVGFRQLTDRGVREAAHGRWTEAEGWRWEVVE